MGFCCCFMTKRLLYYKVNVACVKKLVAILFLSCCNFTLTYGYVNKESPQSGIVYYASEESLAMLKESNLHDFLILSQNFEPQNNPTYCGIATANIILNSIFLPIAKPDSKPKNMVQMPVKTSGKIGIERYFQDQLLNKQTDSKVKLKSVIEWLQGGDPGLSLKNLKDLLIFYKLNAQSFYADGSGGYANFIKHLEDNLAKDDLTFIVVNFDRKTLGFTTGSGHISPLLAYNKQRQMVLVGDVSISSNPWFWVPVKSMYDAMNTLDGQTYRGYIIVKKM